MARKKEISKEKILDGAVDVVILYGHEKFTARKIADYLNISTQPIYLQFDGMDDLKQQAYNKISSHLVEEVYAKKNSDDLLQSLIVTQIDFIEKEPELFEALFYYESFEPEFVQDTILKIGKSILKDSQYENLPNDEYESVLLKLTATSIGVATLINGKVFPINGKFAREIFSEKDIQVNLKNKEKLVEEVEEAVEKADTIKLRDLQPDKIELKIDEK